MVSGEEKSSIPRQARKGGIPHVSFGRFEIASIVLLYSIAAMSLIVGAVFSSEWADQAVSTTFLLTIVIVPFTSVAIAFGVQIIALMRDAKDREQRYRLEAKFLAGLDRCHGGSIVQRNFLGHLLDQWDLQMEGLTQGVVTIQKEYWSVCAQLYGLAKTRVECTSCIPLTSWEEDSSRNKELLKYKRMQIDNLIKHNICVRRTFILDSITKSNAELFLKIANIQLHEGFCIYYINLSQMQNPKHQQLLSQDFALIDDMVLMLGRQSGINQNVYHYDFFELSFSAMYAARYAPALKLISNRADFLAGAAPKLYIEQVRKRIDELPILSDPDYKVYRDAILPQVEALKCW